MNTDNIPSHSSGNAGIKVIAVFLVIGLVCMALWQIQKVTHRTNTVVITHITPTNTHH